MVSLESDTTVERTKLKQITEVIDASPLLDTELLHLYRWASDYYMFPIGRSLQTSLPPSIRAGKALQHAIPEVWKLASASLEPDAIKPGKGRLQQQVLELLRSYQCLTTAELSAALGKPARPVLQALLDKGLIMSVPRETLSITPKLKEQSLVLNPEQDAALQTLLAALPKFQGFLLEGITGSGKTEIYLQLIARVLELGRQALVLVPEISLTPQTLQRFTARFSCSIVAFHSGLTDKQRMDGWVMAQSGKADIVIGTRSAVFTPLPRAGLIIIDEEHDDSYKQQDGFRYSARDVAVYRASQLRIPVVLGSATPALETLNNALSGRYQHLQLGERAGTANPPQLQLVDLRIQPIEEGFSLTLRQQIRARLEAKQQVLVFLNRRGFAPLLQCQDCGWIAQCQRCERSYTLHQNPAVLRCHHCDGSRNIPPICPGCQGSRLGGIGQGTERSEAFLQQEFPDFPVIRIDRDTTRAAGSLQEKMELVHSGLPCILLGTQMLAKGHHFPRVTLVAILDADSGLFSADFRGQENLGQLLTQVAGRAGRGDQPGLVLIQSYYVQHPRLLQLVNEGYGKFARALLAERKRGGLPPFSHLLLLRAEATKREHPHTFLQHAKAVIMEERKGKITVYGPMPSPIGKKAGLYRCQIILQSDSRQRLQTLGPLLIQKLEQHKLARQVRWHMDVDPLDFS